MAASGISTDHLLPECIRAFLATSLLTSVVVSCVMSLCCFPSIPQYRSGGKRCNHIRPAEWRCFYLYFHIVIFHTSTVYLESAVMLDIAQATSPQNNVVVQAAAGTGKTWLLASRVIRLLLEGSEPGAILAITFTRKAASEIHERVTERLLALAGCDEETLPRLLTEIGAKTNPVTREVARHLYEKHLSAIQSLRTTTFHAFCQEILRRFPLEADVPPGFELIETTTELEDAAWLAVDRRALREKESPLSAALDLLLRECGGFHGTRAVLDDFLAHRSDWWAYTENESEPAAFAATRLRELLNVTSDADPLTACIRDRATRERMTRYSELLSRHATTSNLRFAENLSRAMTEQEPAPDSIERIREVFIKKDGEPREIKSTRVLEQKLGDSGAAELISLHQQLLTSLLSAQSVYKRQWTFRISHAWHVSGMALLEEYQRLKLERGLLDFADLEWNTYRLLNRSRHAEWVQYKLDQRIDHLLVDEFQDTNPTQWRLLLPLLQEMVAGDPERRRSVFLVGDEKQSVYRFRRADPRLFHAAHHWLQHHAQAQTLSQHLSRRSSPAVIEFVNLIFHRPDDAPSDMAGDYSLEKFTLHDTHHKKLWGRAELLPLVRRQRKSGGKTDQAWRNPLEQPRQMDEDARHRQEGETIAEKIRALLGAPVADGSTVRPLTGDDVMILLRDRTHARFYEDALRRAGIPYIGTGRGAFRQSLEVRDLSHLLHHLIEPYNDLALASALRSPLFSASEEDLLRLVQSPPGSWHERLLRLPRDESPDKPLARASKLLPRWGSYAVSLPVHDLLDRIYCEGNVIARYLAAAVPHLKPRIEANLNRLLEVALDIDSGRYPSLSHFLAYLEGLSGDDDKTPSQPAWNREPRVRVMTIHAAKGLEAPVVFLANAARGSGYRERGMQPLIDWPVSEDRPHYFHLGGNSRNIDDVSQELKHRHQWPARREESNLLYVALTRARQMLFVSGCEPGKGDSGWYGFIEKRLHHAVKTGEAARVGLKHETLPADDADTAPHFSAWLEFGAPPPLEQLREKPVTTFEIDPKLTKPVPGMTVSGMRHPSRMVPEGDDLPYENAWTGESGSDVLRRGVVMHRMLEQLAGGQPRAILEEALRRELGDRLEESEFNSWWREACRLIDEASFRDFYDPARYQEAHNEMPILYREGGQDIYGVIDRLIIRENEVVLIDYKTHARATEENMALLAEKYQEQMRFYAEGVRRLWPGKKLRMLLLFTACGGMVELQEI